MPCENFLQQLVDKGGILLVDKRGRGDFPGREGVLQMHGDLECPVIG